MRRGGTLLVVRINWDLNHCKIVATHPATPSWARQGVTIVGHSLAKANYHGSSFQEGEAAGPRAAGRAPHVREESWPTRCASS